MFQNKVTFKNFVKRQIAKVLAFVMITSTLLSSGITMNSAYGAMAVPSGTQAFIDNMVGIAERMVKYQWGGKTEASGVDCRQYVKLGLEYTFGTIDGYWVNEDGSLPGGQKISVCLADWDDKVAGTLSYGPNNLGTNRICIEGNGKTAYFRVLAAGTTGSQPNTRDIRYGSYDYSSLIAYACQFPGTIISHNGHCGIGLGEFHSANEILAKYSGLAGPASGTDGGQKIRFAANAYNMGNSYPTNDTKYWFGKTVFLSACSAKSGLRADNFTTSGKTPNPGSGSTFAILQAETEIPKVKITLSKVDAVNKEKILGGAKFGIYTSEACTSDTLVTELTVTKQYMDIELPRGVYYLKELEAPRGYQQIKRVYKIDVSNGVNKRIQFENNPVNSTVLVRKVDKYDPTTILDETKLAIYEYNVAKDDYDFLVNLTYDATIKAFTIKDKYKNNEGIWFSDNSLHFSTTNNGYFAISEEEAHPGYENDHFWAVHDITDPDDQIIYTGDSAITNTAKVSLLVNKVSTDGVTKLEGTRLVLDMGTKVYKNFSGPTGGGTNEFGQTLFCEDDMYDTGYKVLLTETLPTKDYEVTDNWNNPGKIIEFQKGPAHLVTDPEAPDYGRFRTTITIVNAPEVPTEEEPELPVVLSGDLLIRKNDGSRFDNLAAGVQDAKYSLFTVEYDDDTNTKTEVPVIATVNGVPNTEVSNIPTDEDGEIMVEDLEVGDHGTVYYLREVQAPEDYAIQPKTFVINMMSDAADKDGVLFMTTNGVADRRQLVQLSLEKIDALTDIAIPDAVYELRNKTAIQLSTHDIEVPAGTLLGYYKTDINGQIIADGMFSEEFTVNGVTYNTADDIVTVEGLALDGQPLVNGIYVFKEVAAPEGYVLDDSDIEINALWKENATPEDVKLPEGVVTANGFGYIPNTVTVREVRQKVEIEFQKTDFDYPTNGPINHYGFEDTDQYNVMVGRGLVASLENAAYQLINIYPMIDIDTGDTIEAETVLAVKTTDASGKLTFDQITEGIYAGHALPIGTYKLVEVVPPQGYTINPTEKVIVATPDNARDEIIHIAETGHDTILKQDLEIQKVSSVDMNTKLENAEFKLYSVADYIAIVGEDVPMDGENVKAAEFSTKALLADVPYIAATTNAEGKAVIQNLVYGDYVLIESKEPEGYQFPSIGSYLKIPTLVETMADETFYIHDLLEQPEEPYVFTVTNTPKEMVTFSLTLQKVDEETDELITSSNATFELYDSEGLLLETKTTTNGIAKFDTRLPEGEYKIVESQQPEGYEILEEDAELEIRSNGVDFVCGSEGSSVVFPISGPTSYDLTFSVANKKVPDTPVVPEPTPETGSAIIRKYEVIGLERKAVPGAMLQILDENFDVVTLDDGTVCSWDTTDVVGNEDEYGVVGHLIDGLKPGNYYLREIAAPSGYAQAADVPFVVEANTTTEVEMIEKPIVVQVLKVDATSGEQITGADLEMVPVIKLRATDLRWTSDGTPKTFEYVNVGRYQIEEHETPEGYYESDTVTEIIVDDVENVQQVTVKNFRKTGELSINKKHSLTGDNLKDVEFELRSKNKVIDPLTNEVIFEEGEVVATLITDKDGNAKTSADLPIATFDEVGLDEYIVYELVETKSAEGQFDISDVTMDVTFTETEETKLNKVISLHFDIKNNEPKLVVTKTGTPETFEGKYAERHDITVVEDGTDIKYTIKVVNEGDANAYNIVVKDAIPENTILSEFEDIHHATYDSDNDMMYWTIDELAVNTPVELTFTVKANSEKACEIANVAQFAFPSYIPDGSTEKPMLKPDGNNVWNDTNHVVHQIVEFHKTSTVAGGDTKENAVLVAPGDTITYQLTFNSVDAVHNLVVSDNIPKGLTYVAGSAKVNGVVDADVKLHPTDNILTFTTIPTTRGELEFTFDVTVDDIAMGGRNDFENVATATFKDGDTTKTLNSEKVTHYTAKDLAVTKTATPTTFEGVAADAKNVTVVGVNEPITYTIKVKNTGATTLKNIVVNDQIPTELKYKDHAQIDFGKVWVSDDKTALAWCITELKSGDEVELTFSATVKEQKAQLIVNAATYGLMESVGETMPVLPSGSSKTNDVVHQVIEFHKTSEIKGGTDKATAVSVEVGDKISYILEINTKHDLTNLSITDPLPAGLTFVADSTYMKAGNGEWVATPGTVTAGEGGIGTVVFNIAKLSAGQYYFKFDTTVDSVELNKEMLYENKATLECDKMPNDTATEPQKETLTSDTVTHMTYYAIKGNKTGKIETYVGPYESRKDVTVVANGEEIEYTISVENIGKSKIANLIIKDVVPENTKFVKADSDGKHDEKTNTVVWLIKDLEPGKTATVKMFVDVDSKDKAVEIRNKAAFAMGDKIDNVKDKEWVWTDEVIHQTVELHKTASIDHGTDKTDALNVAIGSTFDYIITFEAKNPVYGLTVSDVIPDGLAFVAESAKYAFEDKDAVALKDLKVDNKNTLIFPELEKVPAGTTTFQFKVKVEDVEEYDKDYFFVNKATATVDKSKDSKESVDLTSETVSNKTMKTNKTETPKLGFDTMNEGTLWTIVSIISTISLIGFGWFTLADKKKRK